MAFIYEVNGVKVQFDKEPTDADIDEAANAMGSRKNKPESKMPKPVEGEGGAAFGVYRPAGRRPESQQDREAAKEMPVQTARGVATGMLGGIPDILNLPGQIYGAATNQPAPYTVPLGSEEWNQMLPGRVDTPHANLARMAGQALAPVPVAPIVKGVAETGKGAYGFGKGFARGMAYPEGTAANTALAPIRETYVPHPQVEEFMAGTRPASSLTEVPSASLYENKPIANWAYGMAPENQAGQKLVPYAGRTMEGIGEQIGSGYRTNPLNAAIDIGTTLATGFPAPLTAVARSVPAIAAKQLQEATKFTSGFGPAREAALAREGRAGLEANMPTQNPALPAPGPVNPTMFANQQGVVTGPNGTSLPTQASGQPVTQPATNPKQFSQQVAASKIQPVNPAQQADWAQRSGGGYTPPAQPAPIPKARPQPAPQPTPTTEISKLRSSENIKKELSDISNQSDELHQSGLENGIKYGTPEGESHQAQLGQLHARTKVLQKELEEALKAEKKANKGKKK